ncbi:MAG: glycosyltransferase [Deltaproteobacteria bacterium]|nr:glycosyltransferase [Deltaproteobacteria bacterium]
MDNGSLNNKSTRMRQEWDNRIKHDYRYWMSDGINDDDAMFTVGERDLSIILSDVDLIKAQDEIALELGCGVGRILKPLSRYYGKVIGVDVSLAALEKAQQLLDPAANIELFLGNGFDLSGIGDESVDFAFSFASISIMPVDAIASYLIELARVLKIDKILKLQVYLGRAQDTRAEDTLAIRSFDRQCFEDGCRRAGFSLLSCKELILPFEISDPQADLVAYMVALKKESTATIDKDELVRVFLPQGEPSDNQSWQGSKTEYMMAIACATQHMGKGQIVEAIKALEFAVSSYRQPEPEVCNILEQLKCRQQGGPESVSHNRFTVLDRFFNADYYEKNLRVIEEKFPELAKTLAAHTFSAQISVQTGESQLPVLVLRGFPLDQVNKPLASAQAWVDRSLAEARLGASNFVALVGVASGYHLNYLAQRNVQLKVIVEPNLDLLHAVLGIHDLSELLKGVDFLVTSSEELKKIKQFEEVLTQAELLIYPQTQALSRYFVDECKRIFWSTRGLKELRPSVAVVGPLYGGTLPIAGYLEMAFRQLNQRVYGYDLSCFMDGYRNLGKYFQSQKRIDALQSQYVELLSQMVIEGIEEKPVDLLVCVAQAPLSPKVLTKIREKGIITVMWFMEDCRRFTAWQQISRYFDYMFIIQKEPYLTMVESAGAGRAIYLPMACSPQVHTPLELSAEESARWGSDISFLGAGYHNRQQIFASLVQRDFKIWGTQWPTGYPFDKLVQEQGRRLDPKEYVKIFNASKININLHSSVERDGVEPNGDFINPRTFELASSGAFQLVDNRLHLEELFTPGKELATFADRHELEEKIDYYLAHPEKRKAMAAAGRERALKEHTYVQRLKDMLGYIYADRFAELSRKAAEGPWPKVLETAKNTPELLTRYQALYERGEDPTLNALVCDIQVGRGTLTDTEMKLLFLHHIKKLVGDVNDMRAGKITG